MALMANKTKSVSGGSGDSGTGSGVERRQNGGGKNEASLWPSWAVSEPSLWLLPWCLPCWFVANCCLVVCNPASAWGSLWAEEEERKSAFSGMVKRKSALWRDTLPGHFLYCRGGGISLLCAFLCSSVYTCLYGGMLSLTLTLLYACLQKPSSWLVAA